MGNEWKNTEWQEKAKHKPSRYYIRDEIEEIIKEENIDRHNFFEVSKQSYVNILTQFYYSFFEYEKHISKPQFTDLSYLQCEFRKELKKSQPVSWYGDWIKYIDNVRLLIPDRKKDERFYLILSEGWVYEGYIPEIISVISETDAGLNDFYIVSKKYEWLIAHSDDGECMYTVTK